MVKDIRRVGRANHFTISIIDDVSHTSGLRSSSALTDDVVRAVFWGLGSMVQSGEQELD